MWHKCNCNLALSCSTSNGTLRFLLCSVNPTPYFHVNKSTKAVSCPCRGSHIGLLMPYPVYTGSVTSRFPGQEHLHVMGQLKRRFTDWVLQLCGLLTRPLPGSTEWMMPLPVLWWQLYFMLLHSVSLSVFECPLVWFIQVVNTDSGSQEEFKWTSYECN